jgi:hypothetical protein
VEPPPNQESDDSKSLKPEYTEIRLPDGQIYRATNEELKSLAELGAIKTIEDNKPEEPTEEPTEEDRLKKAEEKIKQLEQGNKSRDANDKLKNDLSQCIEKYDYTKHNPKIAKKVSQLSVARCLANPRLNINEVFAEEVAEAMEIEEDREKAKIAANSKVKSMSAGMVNTGGSSPAFEEERKFTQKELKGTECRKAFEEYLNKLGD